MKNRLLHLFQRACILVLALVSVAYAQNASVSGTVRDQDGAGLPGATVLIEGKQKGAFSDEEGQYTITGLPAGEHTLVISYSGMEKFQRRIVLAEGQALTVDADMESVQIDDVIIVGYGTERKREMTGSISKITDRDLNDVPGASFETTLQGKASGVQVITSSGIAGAGAKITVRGAGSVSAGGDPLYVVDGIPITQDPFLNGDRGGQNNNPLSSINPADIQSIEILKDAAAAAIYGSRGANGVILITTKRGKKGKPVFDLSIRTGISRASRLQDFVNAQEWAQMYVEAWENDGNVGRPSILPGGYSLDSVMNAPSQDWQDLTTGTGLKQEYNLSMRQGTDKLRTFVGISAINTESYLIGNSYARYTGRANIDWNARKNLKFGFSGSGAYGRNNRVSQAWGGGLGAAQSTALPYYQPDAPNNIFGSGNPITRRDHVDWRSIENRTINTLNVEYKPVKNLTMTVNGSLDYMNLGDNIFEDSTWTTNVSIAKDDYNKITNWNTNGFLQYDFAMLPEAHKLTAMVGGEAQRYNRLSGYQSVTDVSKHLYLDWEGTSNSDTVEITNPRDAWSFVSTFARVNYSFKDKYIAKASVRIDGSSKFGRNNRYGVFPALGVGYILSEENFWKEKVKAVNFFKLKASYGVTGNADIPSFLRFGTFSGRDNNIQYNGDSIIFPIRLENPNLSWETTTTIDAGFEMGLFNDRISTEISFYNKESKDVLLRTASPTSSGFKEYWLNTGHIRNRGIELGLTTFNTVGAFKWRTTVNIARNRNEVIDVGTTPPDALQGSGDTRVIPGYPVGVNYLVRFSHVDPATGRPVYLDANGAETFDWNTNNRVAVGSVQPDFQGGITNNFEWKGFDLNVLFTFTVGGNIYDDAAKRQFGVVKDWNIRRDMIDRWTTPGQVGAAYPRLTSDPATYGLDSEWNYNTTQWLYDASYLRMKNIQLGYNFKFNKEKKQVVDRLRLYAVGTNLFLLTKYPGSDPEIVRDHNGPQGRNISPNVTYLTPPQERTFSLGIDVQF